jgi:hypothetical protein
MSRMARKNRGTKSKTAEENGSVVSLHHPDPLTVRRASLRRLWEAAQFDARYPEDSPDPAEQERLRRLDAHGMRIIVAVLECMGGPTAEGAELLAQVAGVLRGVTDPRRKDGATWSVDLADAVAIVATYAPGQTTFERGVKRPVNERDRRTAIQSARLLPQDHTALFVRLFDGLSDDEAVQALTDEYAWFAAGKNRTPASVVEHLLKAALARGVMFPQAPNLGSETNIKNMIGDALRATRKSPAP